MPDSTTEPAAPDPDDLESVNENDQQEDTQKTQPKRQNFSARRAGFYRPSRKPADSSAKPSVSTWARDKAGLAMQAGKAASGSTVEKAKFATKLVKGKSKNKMLIWLFASSTGLIFLLFCGLILVVFLFLGNPDFSGNNNYFAATYNNCNPNISIDNIIKTLAYIESGGDPTARNSVSTASGKYQYTDSTWQSSSSKYYAPAASSAHAYEAPESYQDAVAYLEYTDKYKIYNGDLFDIALSHYLPAAISDSNLLDIVPSGNTLTPREYANRLIEILNNGESSQITLSYTVAPGFQTALVAIGGPADISVGCIAGGVGAGIVVQLALAEVDNKETSPNCGPDINKYFEYFDDNCGYAWCALFVRYIFANAGLRLGTTTNSAVSLARWFSENETFFNVNDPSFASFTPQPGDVYFKRRGDFNGDPGDLATQSQGHTGIVVEVNGLQITTVDGNSLDKVRLRTYNNFRTDIDELIGFGRYAENL